ncbi:MAG: hypothetical protein JST81_13095 [Bacteroidetes bacterium]|nr:hypothetical protein [Bacteroidota bacterium]
MPDQRDKSPHVLNASSNLLGLCFIVLTSIRVFNLKEATLLDEIAMIAITMFMTSCVLSFLSIRGNTEKKNAKLEKIADVFFLSGLAMLFVAALFISFNIIR